MSATLVVGDKPAPAPVAMPETPTPAVTQKPSQPTAPPLPAATQVSPPPPPIQAPALLPVNQDAEPVTKPPSPTQQTVARAEPPAASAEDKAKTFVASFDGGECFLIAPRPGATKPHEYQAVGRVIEPFRRFDSAYKHAVGVEDDLTLALISAEQCPALDLVRLAAPDGRPPPRLTLKAYEVGRGQPLSGTISGLERRRLYLILVDNDGLVHRLETKIDPSGDSATFSVPLTADASSLGPMQMLLAIASDKPVPSLEALHSANLKLIASRLVDDVRAASASVGADYFKFVN